MVSNGSQQSSSAFCGPAAAEQLFSLHAAHLIVVVPRQLGTGPDSSAQKTQDVRSQLRVVTSISDLLSSYTLFRTQNQ